MTEILVKSLIKVISDMLSIVFSCLSCVCVYPPPPHPITKQSGDKEKCVEIRAALQELALSGVGLQC